jgi:spore maturation protein SpmB
MASSSSLWSVAPVVFLASAILSAAATACFTSLRATGPADGAVVVLLVASGAIATWLCALLGAICGAVGMRKTRGHRGLAATVLVLNALICMAPLFWCLLLVLWGASSSF